MHKGGWTYILTNKPGSVLYIGMTSNLPARMTQHRHRVCIEEAIAREQALKAWKRDWKIRLNEEANPGWADLFEHIV